MKNLIKDYMKNYRTKKADFISGLSGKAVNELLNNWYYQSLMPPSSKNKNWELTPLLEYLIKRWELNEAKKLNSFMSHLNTVQESPEVQSITITIEWYKSQMWGNNAEATAKVIYKNGNYDCFKSSRTSGCGYDKESTAVGETLTQINGLLKPMYNLKNRKHNLKNSELFGYGSGHGLLPYFEGGVGLSCYPQIIEKLKGKMRRISSGKTFDVYSITFK